MNRTSRFLVARALPFVLGLGACSAGQVETDDTEVAESEVSTPLVVGSAPGDVKTKKVVVSGQERKSIPSTYNFACGASGHYSSTTTSNVAWVELKNPTAKTASLSLRIDGLPTTYPDLFVYASRTGAPSSCMTFSTTRELAEGSSVVVGANESVFVLLASGTSTGAYTLSVTTASTPSRRRPTCSWSRSRDARSRSRVDGMWRGRSSPPRVTAFLRDVFRAEVAL